MLRQQHALDRLDLSKREPRFVFCEVPKTWCAHPTSPMVCLRLGGHSRPLSSLSVRVEGSWVRAPSARCC